MLSTSITEVVLDVMRKSTDDETWAKRSSSLGSFAESKTVCACEFAVVPHPKPTALTSGYVKVWQKAADKGL